jgi:hypothetical protein
MPDGDLLLTRTDPPLGSGAPYYRITDIRLDGTTVEVSGTGTLAQDQLTAIARAGELTLFP